MKISLTKLADGTTLLVAAATALLLARTFLGAGDAAVKPLAPQDSTIQDWERLATGHRVGPDDAAITIIEWGDYECPVCKWFHEQVSLVREKYPNDVALVYRHWPLSTHRFAYPAARAVECAVAHGGSFESFHDQLFTNDNWLGDAFSQFARNAGVSDVAAFGACIAREEPVGQIESDIAAVRALGGRGTPTLVVNGQVLSGTPSAAQLENLISAVLREARP